jgi:CheY-like chemotaxis protein
MATILVVDDSPVDRRLVAGLLKNDASAHIETADNGLAALEKVRTQHFDLVVTDLQMPELDGLGLVRELRMHGPQVPVILMTAHGSESLAMQALEEGAASYVPKTHLADMLQDTVSQVLALNSADRNYERLSACQTYAEFHFELENDAALVDPLVDLIQQICLRMQLCDTTGKFRIGMAFQQALLNAITHGNLELTAAQVQESRESLMFGRGNSLLESRRNEAPFRDRKVFVGVKISNESAKFIIRDQGPGFDVARGRAAAGEDANLEGGRGLRLMQTFMDDVQFNERGNEVTMTKHREVLLAL